MESYLAVSLFTVLNMLWFLGALLLVPERCAFVAFAREEIQEDLPVIAYCRHIVKSSVAFHSMLNLRVEAAVAGARIFHKGSHCHNYGLNYVSQRAKKPIVNQIVVLILDHIVFPHNTIREMGSSTKITKSDACFDDVGSR